VDEHHWDATTPERLRERDARGQLRAQEITQEESPALIPCVPSHFGDWLSVQASAAVGSTSSRTWRPSMSTLRRSKAL
jgi:hypothetical protein